MKLSRKWLSEFVKVDANDKDFAEAMTISGSKVETTEYLGAEIENVVVGRIQSMERHPDSDHMWVCQVGVGKGEPVQIVTGAWNIHEGDLVPVALHKSVLPGGKKIENGKLRGVLSNGMLCSLKELGLDERDFPYAVIEAAALMNDFHPMNSDAAYGGDSGPIQILSVQSVENVGINLWSCVLSDGKGGAETVVTPCQNIHAGDIVMVNTQTRTICTPADLHAQQAEFPHCIPDGIFILHEDCKPGDDIKPIIGADDHVVEFEITPNRPDCLSVIGLAREVSATFNAPMLYHEPVVKGGADGVLPELLDVETPDPELCPRYTARMVRNVKIAPSPKWMRERLRAMGVRPINNIVDITNYVMLEYGQPMHAFDYRYVNGGKIIVRRAKEGEELTTLDGNIRKLTPNMLVIADENRAVGLAGIMGGENSEIVDDTSYVVFESANFDGTTIRKTALSLGMRTEASAKFEKGLDPMNTLPAVNRACELVELLGAGEVIDGVIDVLNHVPKPTVLPVEPDRINALLGTSISENVMWSILQKLGFRTHRDTVTVPSWRGDVQAMADLAEEVARFYGYNNIPTTLMRGETTRGGYTPAQLLERRLGSLCRSCGYSEIITYSFISPASYDKIGWAPNEPLRNSLRILNPLGEDTSIMRTTALPSMLEVLQRNYNYRNKAVRLYELGKVYLPGGPDGLAVEPQMLTLGAYGGEMDFYSMKGAVEAILQDLRAQDVTFYPCTDDPSYHPGRCAGVRAGEQYIGVVGQIHPNVAANYGVDTDLYCAELSFEALFAAQGPGAEYTPLPRFPAAARDIAVVCKEAVTVGALTDCIRRAGGKLLRDVNLFDIYQGVGIAPGHKSAAFSLTLRSDERSITAAEADEEVKIILEALEKELGAVLR